MYRQWDDFTEDHGFRYYEFSVVPGYFPIVLPPEPDSGACDTPAETPQMLEVNQERRYATVEWQQRAPDGGAQQLAIAPWPSSPDSAMIIPRPASLTTLYTFSNLDTTQTYAVWLRDECCRHINIHRDTTWWTPWSEPLIFSFAPPAPDTLWLNDSTYVLGGDTIVVPHEGIWEISDSMNQISIFPNPTTGEVRVECGEWRAEKIEVLDPQGRLLMEKEYSLSPGHYALNLSSLPKGSYLLRAHTDQGTFTRKVVRE